MTEAPHSPSDNGPIWGRNEWVLGGLLVAATFAVYLKVFHAGFIWDDDRHLTQNPCIIGPLGLKEIWTTSAARICPLVLTTFWVEHAAWGLNPLPYHLVNVLMHAACGIVLWRVLRILGIPGAWLGAALWTLHPVQVETVAWVTEMKNTQSGLFYLLAGYFFLKWRTKYGPDASPMRWTYGAAMGCCALAMASKSSTVVLPVVLGLCAWWMDGRWRPRTALCLIPVALMSAATSLLSIWTQHLEGANDPQWTLGGAARVAVAGKVFWFYLGKLVWPHPLIFIYPRWEIDPGSASSYLATLAMLALLLALWIGRKGPLRAGFFAAAYFFTALLPVLGLVQQFFVRYSFVGDHFQYLASIGPLALGAAGIARVYAAAGRRLVFFGGVLGASVLLALGILTWKQSANYADAKTLWLATNSKNSGSWLVHNNLGIIFMNEGSIDAAIEHYQQAAQINPAFSGTYSNLGIALMKEGRLDEAVENFRKALTIDPVDPETHNNLGLALRRKGLLDPAIDEFRISLKIDPRNSAASFNLGNALQRAGRFDEAIAQFQKTLEIDPRHSGSRFSLANALVQAGRMEEAVAQYEEAVRADPNNSRIHINLGAAFLRMGRSEDAIGQFREAARISPNDADSHVNLGQVLAQSGRLDEAIIQFNAALKLRPDDSDTLHFLTLALEKKHENEGASGIR